MEKTLFDKRLAKVRREILLGSLVGKAKEFFRDPENRQAYEAWRKETYADIRKI